ncbi:MAG: Unknown protein [uncultured Sulfurovum sp.]|uniref:Glycosyltransferase RgtA/B/C/D-like domain-containing protein n=1 Tax=uncultured Sulfurovum sp. TaxID=269237 RepID=A0A6S6ST84_9BACT|nr:MAG: Unknown protein [uncultured Sulfurovum sp.]
MILLQSFIGFYAMFIAPQIFIYYRYNDLKYSLVLSYGMILSFTGSWLLFLIIFYLKIPNIVVQLMALLLFCTSFIYMFRKTKENNNIYYIFWIISFIAIIPLYQYIGTGFNSWDAVNAWNRWGIELFDNYYDPINAAYPLLLPSIWAMLYKVQGTSDIWLISRISMFVLPTISIVLLTTLYYESKNKSYLFMLLFLYPFLIEYRTTVGDMDIPVMIMGTLSLILLYTAELYKEKKEYKYYLYAALLVAGVSSIIKQAGLVFVLFNIIYLLLNLRYIQDKKSIFLVALISLMYFISYLPMYYLNGEDGVVGNIEYLQEISVQIIYTWEEIQKAISELWKTFWSSPYNIDFLKPLIGHFHTIQVMPYVIGFGLFLFIFRDLRTISSVNIQSAIFFLLGIAIWAKYFSYDARNSFWVKSFYIIFLSINLNYLMNKYRPNFVFFFAIVIITFVFAMSTLDNKYAYDKQKSFQQYIGDEKLSKYIVNTLLKNKDTCVKINTNRQYLQFNYYARNVKSQFMIDRLYPLKSLQKNELEHSCRDGKYLILRDNTKSKSLRDWVKIQVFIEKGILKPVKHGENIIYFIPPNQTLKGKYFDK